MRTLFIALLLCTTANAAIKYYDDYPNTANPPSTYILSLQTTDKTVGGTPYNYWTLAQMTEWLGTKGFTNGGTLIVSNVSFQFITNLYAYVTNLYSTNINVSIVTNNYFYTTNVTVEQPGGITNLNLTPLTLMYADVNSAESSVANGTGMLTNNGSGTFGWYPISAILSSATNNDTTISNALYTLIQSGTNSSLTSATNNDTVVSNGVMTAVFNSTNAPSIAQTWGGPSNTVPVTSVLAGNPYYFYTTTTPFSFTNLVAVSGSNAWATIIVSNQTAAAITGYVTIPGIRIYNGTNALIVGAGKTAAYSFLSISTLLTNCQNAAQSN